MSEREFWRCGIGAWNALVEAHQWANEGQDGRKGIDHLKSHTRRA